MTIYFEGKPINAQENDTVASALFRAGRRIFTRSFKYHRPRGLLCLAGKCPNCLVNVDGTPNVRACAVPAREGMRVRSQNAWPSLERDCLSVAQAFDWLMPVGWYYKTMTTQRAWHMAEPYIRKVAGLGDAPAAAEEYPHYEHAHMHADAAVIGGGRSGLHAAIERARAGQDVLLIDDQLSLGGRLRYTAGGGDAVRELIGDVNALPNLHVLQRSYCFGLYEGNLLGVVESEPYAGVAERLVHVRAAEVVVATGAYEAPLPFANNDLPGVMLSSAVERLIHLHGIVPGKRGAIVGTGARAADVAAGLREAGITIVATIELHAVLGASGTRQVTGLRTRSGEVACDLVVVCGHRVPDAGLLHQAGGRLEWDSGKGAFIPADLPPHVTVAGAAGGAGLHPAAELPGPALSDGKRSFVCFCNDVTTGDIFQAVEEGFDHIETLKRYTTATMGPCQGRMCQLPAIGVCAQATGRGIADTGVTTARPPNPSVSLGALAGARHHPIRRTPMHYEHDALGAVWMDMGEWRRPRYYKQAGSSSEADCTAEEYRAVRERAGVIDVSTLGKLDVKGRDAGKLLDKVYTSRLSDLKPGRVRYAVLCDEAGIMLDDGTVSCLDTNHYFITTTTGNLDFVEQWLEWWLVGSGWDAHVTNVTAGLAALNLAGPRARDVLRKLTDCDLDSKAFPYMTCRQTEAGGITAVLLRIGFVGETGWEIHCSAEWGRHLWRSALEAGAEFQIRAFGVEAQRRLRLEKKHVIIGVDTDALTNPFEAGMGWVAKLDKQDFIGKTALGRFAAQSGKQRLVGFVMEQEAAPDDGAAVLVEGRLAGRVTSARYSPAKGRAVGLAWVPAGNAQEGSRIEIRMRGATVPARVVEHAFYDPGGERLRL
jgi:sarcosine oxidase subunit alpha